MSGFIDSWNCFLGTYAEKDKQVTGKNMKKFKTNPNQEIITPMELTYIKK